MNILLLEDDIALHKAIKKILEIDGHTVVSFYSGDDLIENFNVHHYDFYILDINVPGINGLEILHLIHNCNPQSKIIMISANIDLGSIKEAYASGCADYLKKPFHIEELRLKIQQYHHHLKIFLDDVPLKKNQKLTKMERLFLALLFENRTRIVTYSIIESEVYKDKNMAIDSLRTLVRRLRKKLENDIIENIAGEGYQIKFLD